MNRPWIWIALIAGVTAALWLVWPTRGTDTDREPAPNEPAVARLSEGADESADENLVTLSAEAIRRGGIATIIVTDRPKRRVIESTGRIEANQDATARVGSFVEGRVTRVLATVGDRVTAGQVVIQIHSHELSDAQATLRKAQTDLALSQRTLATARVEFERAERLLAAKAVSVREHLVAQTNVASAEVGVQQARSEVQRAEEFLHHLGHRPSTTGATEQADADEVLIVSPIAGIVMQRNVSIGTVVTPATDLMLITDLATLWAVAEVPERDATLLRPGQSATIRVAAFPNRPFDARVEHIGESLDAQTRTLRVRAVVRNPSGTLRPEMYATVQIHAGQEGQTAAVPVDAVQEIDGASVVFIDRGDGKYEKRVVQVAGTSDGYAEIASGLTRGDRVVTKGAFLLKSQLQRSAMEEK